MTSTDKAFSVFIEYLQHERKDNYTWALGTLRNVISEGALSVVVVTDREVFLMNSILVVFPRDMHLLCRWHINKNVLVKCKKLFETKEKWDMFNAFWNMLVSSSTEDHYNLQFDPFLKEFSSYPEVVNYI